MTTTESIRHKSRVHEYAVTGMTCGGCQAKVEHLLAGVPGIRKVTIDLPGGKAILEMDKHIPTEDLKAALKEYPKYQISAAGTAIPRENTSDGIANGKGILNGKEIPNGGEIPNGEKGAESRSWLAIYKPILLIFGYITAVSLIASITVNARGGASVVGGVAAIDGSLAMRVFMSGFFLVFSFFKLLDLRGFADSYAMYDIVAKRFRYWGYCYAFLEAGLGIAFALNFQPLLVNFITVLVMGVSIIGVLRSVLNKRKIQCACLGAVFNLPMSTVTIIEDALMIAMSGLSILQILSSHHV